MKNSIYIISVFVICLTLGLAIFFYKLKKQESDLINTLEMEREKIAVERLRFVKKKKEIDQQIENIRYDITQYAQKIELPKCQIKLLEFSPNIHYFSPLCSPKLYQLVKQGYTDVGVDQLDAILEFAGKIEMCGGHSTP